MNHVTENFNMACKSGNLTLVKTLIQGGYPQDQWVEGFNGACQYDQLKIVKFFIHVRFNDLNHGFHLACVHKSAKTVKFLLLIPQSYDYKNSFLEVCRQGSLEMVKLLVPFMNTPELNEGFISACYRGHEQIIFFLWYIGITNFIHGFEAACHQGDVKIIQWLLPKIPLDIQDYGFVRNGCYNAIFRGHVDLFLFLFSLPLIQPIPLTTIRVWFGLACRRKSLEMVQSLLVILQEQGVIDFNFAFGDAVSSGKIEIIQYLINHGANDWNRGLKMAVDTNNYSMVQFMMKCGASNKEEMIEYAKLVKHSSIIPWLSKSEFESSSPIVDEKM